MMLMYDVIPQFPRLLRNRLDLISSDTKTTTDSVAHIDAIAEKSIQKWKSNVKG